MCSSVAPGPVGSYPGHRRMPAGPSGLRSRSSTFSIVMCPAASAAADCSRCGSWGPGGCLL
eukprot:8045604-Pyramimonas_sp.AAC.1